VIAFAIGFVFGLTGALIIALYRINRVTRELDRHLAGLSSLMIDLSVAPKLGMLQPDDFFKMEGHEV